MSCNEHQMESFIKNSCNQNLRMYKNLYLPSKCRKYGIYIRKNTSITTPLSWQSNSQIRRLSTKKLECIFKQDPLNKIFGHFSGKNILNLCSAKTIQREYTSEKLKKEEKNETLGTVILETVTENSNLKKRNTRSEEPQRIISCLCLII